MAIEPKGGRKRISKRSAKKNKSSDATEEVSSSAEIDSVDTDSSDKKSAAIPVPMFQAAPATIAPAKNKNGKNSGEKNNNEEKSEDSEDERGNRKRRRRGGRGRRHGNSNEESNESAESSNEDSNEEESSSEETNTHRRRRRRRSRGAGGDVTEGEIIEEDGVKTVVKVREPKQREERSSRHDRHAVSYTHLRAPRD